MPRRTRKLLTLAATALFSPLSRAADQTWIATSPANFTDPSAWQNSVPGHTDTAVFNTDAANIDITQNTVNQSLRVDSGNLAVNLHANYTLTAVNNSITVSNAGFAIYSDTDGAFSAGDVSVTTSAPNVWTNLFLENIPSANFGNITFIPSGFGYLRTDNSNIHANSLSFAANPAGILTAIEVELQSGSLSIDHSLYFGGSTAAPGASVQNLINNFEIRVGDTTLFGPNTNTFLSNSSLTTGQLLISPDISHFFWDSSSITITQSDASIGPTGTLGPSFTINQTPNYAGQPGTYLRDKSLIVANNTIITDSGRLDVDGSFSTGTLTVSPNGSLNFYGGSISLTNSNLDVSAIGPFGPAVIVAPDHAYSARGSVNISSGSSMIINGGSLTAAAINKIGNAAFTYAHGTLALATVDLEISPTGLLGSSVALLPGDSLTFHSAHISPGASLVINGGSFTALQPTTPAISSSPGGQFLYQRGTLTTADSYTLSPGSPFGPNFLIGTNSAVNIGGLSDDPATPGFLTINFGGTLNTNAPTSLGNGPSNFPISVDINGSSWTATDAAIGDKTSASLAITNGGEMTAANSLLLAAQSGSSATVIIDGPGSSLSVTNAQYRIPVPFAVGLCGTAFISVSNGASVNVNKVSLAGAIFSLSAGTMGGHFRRDDIDRSGAAGFISVRGLGSSFNADDGIVAGASGPAGIIVSDGASVTTYNLDFDSPGDYPRSITATGPNTVLAPHVLTAGTSTTVSVSNDASLVTYEDYLRSGSTVIADGPGTVWTIYYGMRMESDAHIVLENGATLTCPPPYGPMDLLILGTGSSISLSGQGTSFANVGRMWEIGGGTTLEVSNSALFSTQDVTAQNLNASISTGGKWEIAHNLDLSNDFANPPVQSVIHVAPGGIVNVSGNIHLQTPATQLLVDPTARLTADSIISVAQVSFAGSIQLIAGSISTSEFSSLTIAPTGHFDLTTHPLLLDNSFSPATLRSYLATGQLFSSAATDSSLLGYSFTSDPTQLIVRLTHPGDANLDSVVDIADFQIFLDGLASGGSYWFEGDFTCDGRVDLGNDFNLFLTSYFAESKSLGDLTAAIDSDNSLTVSQKASLLAATSVPEPTALVLLPTLILLSRPRRHPLRDNNPRV